MVFRIYGVLFFVFFCLTCKSENKYVFFSFLFSYFFFFFRSTNPLHQRQTHHQQLALVTNHPHLQGWCHPPRRLKATPPFPQPQLCTTPPTTVACPPISVNGMFRTTLKWSNTHSFHWVLGHVHTGGTRTLLYFLILLFWIYQGRWWLPTEEKYV